MKLPKFNIFIKNNREIVEEVTEANGLKDWTVGDVKKIEKQINLVISKEKSLQNSKEKLQKILESFSGHKGFTNLPNKLAFQKNPESFLEILRQMFPDIVK